MPKRTPKEDEKDTKRKQKRVWLNSILLDHAKEKKDSTTDKWKTLARYIEEAVEEKINRVDEYAIVQTNNTKNNNNNTNDNNDHNTKNNNNSSIKNNSNDNVSILITLMLVVVIVIVVVSVDVCL